MRIFMIIERICDTSNSYQIMMNWNQALTAYIGAAIFMLIVLVPGLAPAQESAPKSKNWQSAYLDEIGGDTDTRQHTNRVRNTLVSLRKHGLSRG